MAGEVATLAGETMPYVGAALSAYGGAVLAKAEDSAAGATVSAMARVGKKLLQRIFGRKSDGEALPVVLADAVENPGDEDYLTALQGALIAALKKDSQVLAEVREILAEAGPSVTVSQKVKAGRDVYNAGRDMNITR